MRSRPAGKRPDPRHGRKHHSIPARHAARPVGRGRPPLVTSARRPPLPVEPGAIARRYARALLDVAREQKGGSLHELRDELLGFAQLLETNGELRQAVLSPALPAEARRRVLAALAGRAGASPLLHRLLELLVSHERLAELPAIARAYRDALDALEGRVRGCAVTAVPLAEPQRSALAAALRGAVSRTVDLENRVDPQVLGGVLVKIAGRTFDGTVRTRLSALRGRLASGR